MNKSYNVQYKAEAAKYTKKDGVTALCFLVYILVAAYIFGLITVVFGLSQIAAQIAGMIFALIGLAPWLIVFSPGLDIRLVAGAYRRLAATTLRHPHLPFVLHDNHGRMGGHCIYRLYPTPIAWPN